MRPRVGPHARVAAAALLCAGAGLCHAEAGDWTAAFQSTYVWQAKPAFTSPYEGPHSLGGAHATSYSFTATAALGWRPARHTEIYFNPEAAQGVPFSGLAGLAGFSNGELARTSGASVTVYRARLFLRQTLPLQADSEDVEADFNQFAARQAPRRWVFTLGNVSVQDIFDANSYSHDPRTQFLNWTVMTHGAYDFAADARGYTWGAAAEYIAPGWALRLGRFAQPREPNQMPLDRRIGRHWGDQVELTKNYALADDAPGAVRLLAWRNRAVMARYADALALADRNGGVPDVNAVRHGEQTKSGLGLNVEQAVNRRLGLFARAMWADGKTETYAFTEADRSLSLGAVLGGAAWGRGADALGLALAQNTLSRGHRDVLARGGITFFLGDGALRYAPERIVEAYCAFAALPDRLTFTLDLQRIWNPGYNASRGPASFYGVRAHAEF